MTQDRSNLLAKTFLLPQQQVNYQQPVQQPYDDGVQALEGLQVVQGQTADYYKKVSALKSFMQSVNKNLGIDVRVPDLSRPESIELNQIYQKALADILAQGNELKQSSGIYSMLINRGDHLTKGAYDKPAARFQHGVDYYGGVDKAITETNDFTSTPSYSKEEYDQKLAVYKQRKQEYEKLRDENPDKKEYYDYQLRALTPPAQRQYRPYNESSYSRRQGTKDNAMEVAFRKAVNFTDATTKQWTVSNKPVPGHPGQFYRENKEYNGMQFGDAGIVDRAISNPVTGDKEFILKGGQRVAIDANDPIPMMQAMVDRNPRFGFTGEDMYDYIQRKGLYSQSGALNVQPFLASPEERAANTERMAQEEAVRAAEQKSIIDAVKLRTKGKKRYLLLFNDVEDLPIKLGVGTSVKLEAAGDGKFKIANFDAIFPKSMFIIKGQVSPKFMELKNQLTTGQSIDKILEVILPMVNPNDYPAIYEAFGISKPGTQIAPQQPANNPIDW